MAINIYCSKVAIGDTNDGTSWTNAYLTLEEAFIDANSRPLTDGIVTVLVDYNDYTLSIFDMTRPFNIIGSNENRNGIYTKSILYIDELTISYSDEYLAITFDNLYFISTIPTPTINYDVPYNSSALTINNCNINGHIFINSIVESIVNIYDSNISTNDNTIVGVFFRLDISRSKIISEQSIISANSQYIIINYSKLISQNTTINTLIGVPLNLIISYTLLKNTVVLNNNNVDLKLYITNSTIDGSIVSVSINSTATFNSNILLSDVLNKTEVIGELSYTNNAYVIQPITPDISINNKHINRPKFKNEELGDYTLMHGYGITLSIFELLDKNDGIDFNIKSLKIRDTDLLERYTYQFQNTLTLTNYMLERKFADLLYSYNYYNESKQLEYNINYKKIFNLTNQKTIAAFSLSPNDSVKALWPYEWDYFKIDTPEVEPKSYIIPRSIIDITDIIKNEFSVNTNIASIQNFKIITLKKVDHYGLAYDYFISDKTNKYLWSINEQNILTLTNVYNGSVEANYPLMSKLITAETTLIRPSGLIKYGHTTDGYYNYTLEDNPNVVIKGIDDDYKFEWLCTEIDDTYDFGGMLAYKGNIFVGVKYTNSDETKLLVYPSRGTFKDYSSLTPEEIVIPTSGLFPSDITVLEDGTFLIANSNNNIINHYQPMYDYALIRSNTKDDTKLLLREQYEDIKL